MLHARCPQYADRSGINNRTDVWNWVAEEIKGNIGDGDWLQAACLGAIAGVFARTPASMGSCCFPLYFAPAVARELFDIWKLINERRMGRQGWSFSATSEGPSASQPALTLLRLVAVRIQDRARGRYLWARKLEPDQDFGVRADEPCPPEPPDREAIPAEPVGNSL